MTNKYWSEEYLRPNFVGDEVWQKILSNFLSQISDPVGDLPNDLSEDISRLEGIGFSEPSDLLALMYEFEQAGDFGSLAERGRTGSMGPGWFSLADVKLQIAADGAKVMTGLVNTDALKALDATRSAEYVVSLPLRKTIGQDGQFVVNGPFVRPSFTENRTTYGDMILTEVTGGYEVTSRSGEKYVFDSSGELQSFFTSTGEEITVTNDVNGRLERYEDEDGNYVEFTYDVNDQIDTVEDGFGQTVSFNYNMGGELSDVGDDAGDTEFDGVGHASWGRAYGDRGTWNWLFSQSR